MTLNLALEYRLHPMALQSTKSSRSSAPCCFVWIWALAPDQQNTICRALVTGVITAEYAQKWASREPRVNEQKKDEEEKSKAKKALGSEIVDSKLWRVI